MGLGGEGVATTRWTQAAAATKGVDALLALTDPGSTSAARAAASALLREVAAGGAFDHWLASEHRGRVLLVGRDRQLVQPSWLIATGLVAAGNVIGMPQTKAVQVERLLRPWLDPVLQARVDWLRGFAAHAAAGRLKFKTAGGPSVRASGSSPGGVRPTQAPGGGSSGRCRSASAGR